MRSRREMNNESNLLEKCSVYGFTRPRTPDLFRVVDYFTSTAPLKMVQKTFCVQAHHRLTMVPIQEERKKDLHSKVYFIFVVINILTGDASFILRITSMIFYPSL